MEHVWFFVSRLYGWSGPDSGHKNFSWLKCTLWILLLTPNYKPLQRYQNVTPAISETVVILVGLWISCKSRQLNEASSSNAWFWCIFVRNFYQIAICCKSWFDAAHLFKNQQTNITLVITFYLQISSLCIAATRTCRTYIESFLCRKVVPNGVQFRCNTTDILSVSGRFRRTSNPNSEYQTGTLVEFLISYATLIVGSVVGTSLKKSLPRKWQFSHNVKVYCN